MPESCCVVGCNKRRDRDGKKGIRFFRFPSDRRSKERAEITKERQIAWKKAINRRNLKESSLKYTVICSKHFISGCPADLKDRLNPDWVPNKNMGYKTKLVKSNRYKRMKKRKLHATSVLEDNIPDTSTAVDPEVSESVVAESSKLAVSELSELEKLKKQLAEKDLLILEYKDVTANILKCHKEILKHKDATIDSLTKQLKKGQLSMESLRDDDTKVTYFTGLPNFAALETVFDFVKEDLSDVLIRGINVFDAFIIVLMRLRLDLPFTYLSYKYGVALSTLSKVFHKNLLVLNSKVGAFIPWPDEIALERDTPAYFRDFLDRRFTAIIDFFEIFIGYPGSAPARSEECSSSKKHNTLKYLIAISPAGAITFVSKGYDGKCSDKDIVEKCGFMDFTKPGDIVLSDRGFIINEVVLEEGAKVLMPAFQAEEDQMARVRNHFERVVRILRQKYLILGNPQPISAVSKKIDDQKYFDCIVKVCCGLVNICPTVVNIKEYK